jgi:hypothetical protein
MERFFSDVSFPSRHHRKRKGASECIRRNRHPEKKRRLRNHFLCFLRPSPFFLKKNVPDGLEVQETVRRFSARDVQQPSLSGRQEDGPGSRVLRLAELGFGGLCHDAL